jgi:hypothetical protein
VYLGEVLIIYIDRKVIFENTWYTHQEETKTPVETPELDNW